MGRVLQAGSHRGLLHIPGIGSRRRAALFGGARAPAFSPADLAGLYLWWDARTLSTLYQDAALTTPVTVTTDPVGGWVDRTGNARNALLNGADSKRPQYQTNVLNGFPGVKGDGTDSLQAASIALEGTFYVAAVARRAAQGLGMLCELSATASSNDGFYIGDANTEAQGEGARVNDGTTNRSMDAPANWMQNDAARVIELEVLSGAAPVLRCDGAQVATAASSTFTGFGPDTLNLFARNNASLFWSGWLGELLIYTPVPAGADRLLVRTYLASRWGVTL